MKQQPKMTIITAAYNLIEAGREQTFRQCLEQVHNQTYKNIEHIIILTPSTDGTEELINEYVKKDWVTYHIENQKGLWKAMVKGTEVAGGDFINFMNSDDYFNDSNAIELIVNALVSEQADYAYSNATVLYEDGSTSSWGNNYDDVPFGRGLCHQTMFVSMNVMREFRGFDINGGISLDNHMMLKLQIKNKKPVYIEKSLVTFRHGGWSSQLKAENIKKDYQINFYKQIGKSFGLTMDECGEIWCFSAIQNKSTKYCRELALKIKNEKWQKTFLDKLEQKINDKSNRYHYLFKFIPIIRVNQNKDMDNIKYYLFGFIPLWRIKKSANKKHIKHYLFHFIPTLKIKTI